MEKNRIEKLLLSEYEEFSDMVLIESPFAETTRDGRGVREVALGLTSSKLIIATDIFPGNNEFMYPSNLDSSIETLELVSIYPLEYVTLSIFRRKRRKTLKARFTDGRANYFELGGMNKREIYWSLWCEHIRILLSQKENGSSLSETTAASSSSVSTRYFLSSDEKHQGKSLGKIQNRCVCRLWRHYGGAGDNIRPSWIKKDTYMGPNYNELGPKYYSPIPIQISKTSIENLWNDLRPSRNQQTTPKSCYSLIRNDSIKIRKNKYCNCDQDLSSVLFTQEHNHLSENKYLSKNKTRKKLESSSEETDHITIPRLSRFGFGVEEKCTAGLYLPPSKRRQSNFEKSRSSRTFTDPYKIIESGVTIWEQNILRKNNCNGIQSRHIRRYGLATAPHFLYGLGTWSVQEGDKISIQSKKSVSSINIRNRIADNELKLPISKRQLVTSVSMTSLDCGMLSLIPTDQSRVLLFWTPEYWYRPRTAVAAYQEYRQHLDSLRDFQQTNREKGCKKFLLKKNNDKNNVDGNYEKIISCDKTTCILNRIFLMTNVKKKEEKIDKEKNAKSINKLRNSLKMNSKISAWDLNSTTLAKELTLIDRDLFLRIPMTEIKILIYQKSSRYTPNIGALVTFSHRISCLISSEILSINNLNIRTRILARFINAANKCFIMGNFQSCRSILAGLQSPAIFRLKLTWKHLKTHHSTCYEMMLKLCNIFKNPRTKNYTKAWDKAEQCPPLIPYIGDIFIRILGLDINSNRLFCECPERMKVDKPAAVQMNWKGDSTYLSKANEQNECSTNAKIIPRDKLNNVNLNGIKKKKCNFKREESKIKKENKVKEIFTLALIKLRHGKYIPIKSSRKSIFWAVRQLILARKYFERWQLFTMTARIIIENETRKKLIDERAKKIEEVTSWLLICQQHAQDYDFSAHSLAREFLLKARYREERENFEFSRRLEPILDSH